MGSPIRSEIWACLAPGNPALAVTYAYEDAIVDHAGGEGLWGEVFNAALEAAAFVQQDPQELLRIGLSYIPVDCATARAVRAAIQAHQEKLSWQEARQRVIAATPHYNAQYAPLNMGFQTIGWLYGQDFGNALCTAVNCGYDTDCTGATLGALLGIIGGRAALPEKWTRPLGETIATNESWGGLRNASTGSNPVPATLQELTDRVCRQGARLLALRESFLQIGTHTDLHDIDSKSLYAPSQIVETFEQTNPLQLTYTLGGLLVTITYEHAPVIAPGMPARIEIQISNLYADTIVVDTTLTSPVNWMVEGAEPAEVRLNAGDSTTLHYTLSAPRPELIHNSNTALFVAQPRTYPATYRIPVVLLGARRWQIWGPEEGQGQDADTLLDQEGQPEKGLQHAGSVAEHTGKENAADWRVADAEGNALTALAGTNWSGTFYARLFLWNPQQREVRMGIPATCPRKLWVNGQLLHQSYERSLLRPNYGGDGVSYANMMLQQGWHEVLIKYTRDQNGPDFAAHFTLSTTDLYKGIVDIGWTQLPWER